MTGTLSSPYAAGSEISACRFTELSMRELLNKYEVRVSNFLQSSEIFSFSGRWFLYSVKKVTVRRIIRMDEGRNIFFKNLKFIVNPYIELVKIYD